MLATHTSTATVDYNSDYTLASIAPCTKKLGAQRFVWHSHTPDGPVTVELRRTSATKVSGQSWGPGHRWAIQRLPKLVGAQDNLAGFTPPPPLERLWRRKPFVFGRTDQPWEALVHGVFGQKVQTTKARASERLLAARYGTEAPGPHSGRLLPTVEQVANMAYHHLHPAGVERKRADSLIRAARELVAIPGTSETSPENFKRRFERLRGIGPWTTNVASLIAYGDADSVPVGDFHLPNTVCWALQREPRGTDERMLELLEPYRGHRGRVLRLAKLSGSAPKYGPRLSLEADGMFRGR